MIRLFLHGNSDKFIPDISRNGASVVSGFPLFDLQFRIVQQDAFLLDRGDRCFLQQTLVLKINCILDHTADGTAIENTVLAVRIKHGCGKACKSIISTVKQTLIFRFRNGSFLFCNEFLFHIGNGCQKFLEYFRLAFSGGNILTGDGKEFFQPLRLCRSIFPVDPVQCDLFPDIQKSSSAAFERRGIRQIFRIPHIEQMIHSKFHALFQRCGIQHAQPDCTANKTAIHTADILNFDIRAFTIRDRPVFRSQHFFQLIRHSHIEIAAGGKDFQCEFLLPVSGLIEPERQFLRQFRTTVTMDSHIHNDACGIAVERDHFRILQINIGNTAELHDQRKDFFPFIRIRHHNSRSGIHQRSGTGNGSGKGDQHIRQGIFVNGYARSIFLKRDLISVLILQLHIVGNISELCNIFLTLLFVCRHFLIEKFLQGFQQSFVFFRKRIKHKRIIRTIRIRIDTKRIVVAFPEHLNDIRIRFRLIQKCTDFFLCTGRIFHQYIGNTELRDPGSDQRSDYRKNSKPDPPGYKPHDLSDSPQNRAAERGDHHVDQCDHIHNKCKYDLIKTPTVFRSVKERTRFLCFPRDLLPDIRLGFIPFQLRLCPEKHQMHGEFFPDLLQTETDLPDLVCNAPVPLHQPHCFCSIRIASGFRVILRTAEFILVPDLELVPFQFQPGAEDLPADAEGLFFVII